MNEAEQRTLVKMLAIYCKGRHKTPKGTLCADCEGLRIYAFYRLDKCRYGSEKPTCQSCVTHCYKPDMREKVREVMRYAGPRMLFYHPVLAVKHLARHLLSDSKRENSM